MGDAKKPGWGAFLPRFNIPETFGAALSYEGQLHWFLENWDDVAEYANALEQPTIDVGKTEFPDTSNALTPSITNVGTDINAVLDFTYPVIRTRFANPLQWDFDTAYDVLTVVRDTHGNSYTSRQAVPANTALSDPDYWVMTGSYDANLQEIRDDIAGVKSGYVRTYATVADMQDDETILTGMICRTLGFHSIGRGGAYYVIGTAPANGFDILDLATNSTASLVIPDSRVSADCFGCHFDGSTDDAPAIRRAISALSAGTLVFGRGSYCCASTIVLKAGVTLSGCSTLANASSLKLADHANVPIIQSPYAAGGSETHFCCIENLEISGNRANQDSDITLVDMSGLYVGSYIHNCYISGYRGCALVLNRNDMQIDHLWVQGGYSEAGRYAIEINPNQTATTCMIDMSYVFVENHSNKASGNPRSVQADRGNGIYIGHGAKIVLDWCHFEGVQYPVTVDYGFSVSVENMSMAWCGNASSEDSSAVIVIYPPRALSIDVMNTTTACNFFYWVYARSNPGSTYRNIEYNYNYPSFMGFACPVNTLFPGNNLYNITTQQVNVRAQGGASNTDIFQTSAPTASSNNIRYRVGGTNYYISRYVNDAWNDILQHNCTDNEYEHTTLNYPLAVGARTNSNGMSTNSIARMSNSDGSGLYVWENADNYGHVPTVHTKVAGAPAYAPAHVGDMVVAGTALYIAIGTTASDWKQVSLS